MTQLLVFGDLLPEPKKQLHDCQSDNEAQSFFCDVNCNWLYRVLNKASLIGRMGWGGGGEQ